MKITELKYTKRTNLGNYEHAELSATAILEDNEDAAHTFYTLKSYVELALLGELIKHEKKEIGKNEEVVSEVKVVLPVEEAPIKEKKTRAKKEKAIEPVVEAPVVEEVKEEPKAKNVVAYNSSVAEHKSIFGGYLVKKYGNAWKTSHPAEEIKAFTSSLNGKHFLDDQGNIVPSFLDLVHGFFGA